ncbi:cytoskeleton-associated protein 2 isoform X2 [Lissotriton helveticus]
MSSALFSVSRQSISHRFLSGREQRPREAEQFSRKSSFVGPGINQKGAQSRSNWNALHGVTVRKKKSCTNPTQIMEDKENAGKQPVLVNPVERTGITVLQTIQSPNLCAASVISKDFENLRLEEIKSLSLEQNTAAISRSHSSVKSVADKHSVADTGNAGSQNTKKALNGLEKCNPDAKFTKKPIRGVFRGRVVQSKISSFWKVSNDESQAKASVLSNNLAKSQPSNNSTAGLVNNAHFTIKSSRKESNCPLDKARSVGVSKRPAKHSASTVKPAGKKQSSVPVRMTTVSNYVKVSSTAFSAHGTAPRLNSCSDLVQKTKPATAAELPSGKMHPSSSFKVCKSTKKQLSTASAALPNGKMHPSKSFNVCKDIKRKEKPLSTAVTLGKNSYRPPVKQCLPTGQGNAPGARQSRVSKTTTLASSNTISAPFRPKTVSEILTAASTRCVHPKESAEEQRARLARWQASKGKVMKRPPMVKTKVLPPDVQIETVPIIPERVNDDLQRLSEEEADEKDSECTNLNQTVDMLQNIPLNQNVDSPKYEKEIGKEEQNNNGELEDLKHLVKNEGLVDHETNSEINDTFEKPKTENMSSKKKLNLRRAYQKAEDDKDGEVQFITCSQFRSPDNEAEGSSVIRFNVRTTPSLKSLSNNMHSQLGDSTFKDFKFLTPVRRSLRIERKSFRLPEMLHDHDPCLSSLGELSELEGDVNAYIFRENNALRDLAKHANQQKET